jgi:hypothetical protein
MWLLKEEINQLVVHKYLEYNNLNRFISHFIVSFACDIFCHLMLSNGINLNAQKMTVLECFLGY